MRFLLEFVTCCGSAGGDGSRKEVPVSAGRTLEETRALVSRRRCSRKKRDRRSTASSTLSSAEWKPTLRSISEDNVSAVEDGGTARVVKRKGRVGAGRSRDIASLSGHLDDYRRNHFQAVIPAFSPTPFII